jgi:hypothetical protein
VADAGNTLFGFSNKATPSRNTCDTSPVIGVIRARAYTSIREVLLQVLRISLLESLTCRSSADLSDQVDI